MRKQDNQSKLGELFIFLRECREHAEAVWKHGELRGHRKGMKPSLHFGVNIAILAE